MAILGGDDAGGGVKWAPKVINDAKDFGLILGEDGLLYDTKKGQSLPNNINPMPVLTDEELKNFPEITTEDFLNNFFVSSSELHQKSKNKPAKVIGREAILKDRPGFEVDFITDDSFLNKTYSTNHHEVNMIMNGEWELQWDSKKTNLGPGDTCLIPPNLDHKLVPRKIGNASLFRVTNTDDPAGSTWLR